MPRYPPTCTKVVLPKPSPDVFLLLLPGLRIWARYPGARP